MLEVNVLFVSLLLFAYLAGSLSTAIIVCRAMGLPDPRTEGSNNPGATNVLRLGGKKAAAITLAGDAVKGLIPVLVAQLFELTSVQLSLIAIAAFLGHLYPVFFRFKGGKGVATAFGALSGVSWPVGLMLAATWLAMAYVFKISSLSALTAACLMPFYFWFWEADWILVGMSVFISLSLIWRHRSNIHDLIRGTEEKI